jgi:hypothetical protein
MMAMMCLREQVLPEIPQGVEGMEGENVSKQAGCTGGLARSAAVRRGNGRKKCVEVGRLDDRGICTVG